MAAESVRAKRPRRSGRTRPNQLLPNETVKMEDNNSDEESQLDDDDANYQWSESDQEKSGNESDVMIVECLSDSGESSEGNDQAYEVIFQNNGWDRWEDTENEIEFDDDDDGEWDESDLENGANERDVMIGEYLLNSRDSEPNVRVKTNWINPPSLLKDIPFTGNFGVMTPIPINVKVLDCFYMLATDDFFDLVIRETNNYAHSPIMANSPLSVAWEDLTKEELCVFLGLVLHMGNIRLTRTKDYWATDPLFNISCFSEAMTRKRFVSIMKCLEFARNPEPGQHNITDKLYKIRPLIDFFNIQMNEIYYPTKDLIIDESMILWHNRLMFRKYTKNKKNKNAIKMYTLREAKGMVIKCAIYVAAIDDMGETNHAADVVLHLLKEKLNAGHSVYMDHYYNSYTLSCKLLEQNTYSTGTLRSERKDNPREVLEEQLTVGKSVCKFSNGVIIGKWTDTRPDARELMFISTEHNDEMIVMKSHNILEETKPKIIVEYNKVKSQDDKKDQIFSHYHSTRRNLEWHKKIGIHVIELMVLNAFELFCLLVDTKMGFYEFRLAVINELVPAINTTKKPTLRRKIDKTIPHFIERYGKSDKGKQMRKRCRYCSRMNKRSDSMFYCKTCPDLPGLCVECFDQYHI